MNRGLAVLGTGTALIVCALLTWAVSSGQVREINQIPIIWYCVGIAFVIQWIGFAIAFSFRTERFFDGLGSATFICLIWLAVYLSGNHSPLNLWLALFVTIWAVRLGMFLTLRLHKTKIDRRFNSIRNDFFVFLMTWTLQGMWVSITLLPALIVLTSKGVPLVSTYLLIGALIWVIGFTIEVIADM